MINLPPNPSIIKNGISSTLQFMLKKSKALDLFSLNIKDFWNCFWVLFILNAFTYALTAIILQKILKFEDDLLIVKFAIMTVVQISLYSIAVNRLLILQKKEGSFFQYIIPFYWLQITQSFLGLVLAVLALFFPGGIIFLLKICLVIWFLYSVWRLGKHEIGFSDREIIGFICLNYFIDLSVLVIFFAYISPFQINSV